MLFIGPFEKSYHKNDYKNGNCNDQTFQCFEEMND